MEVITRFAPSPTGFLHIGGARTALFNWLFAKANKGKFFLRIEDTDRERSTDEAIEAIKKGLIWLGLDWDGKEVYQFSRAEMHKQAAYKLLEEGKAYRCYCTKEEIEKRRESLDKKPFKYDSYWRNNLPSEDQKNKDFVIRLKAPMDGEVEIDDMVQGKVKVSHEYIDDLVLLRSDSTPTYMLSVVVDDNEMGITHVIRGDDHLNNSFKQKIIYEYLGFNIPIFSHIPLIHGIDGAKLSKRHGALGVNEYENKGYLPEAMCNYLLRLGWSHGNDEFITRENAIEWFSLKNVGKSPSRFDFAKLDSLNSLYIREIDEKKLLNTLYQYIGMEISEVAKKRLELGIGEVKKRAKTLVELAENSKFYIVEGITEFTDKAKEILNKNITLLKELTELLEDINIWNRENIKGVVNSFCNKKNLKMGEVMCVARAAITGSHISPSMFEAMEILGKEESLKRLYAVE